MMFFYVFFLLFSLGSGFVFGCMWSDSRRKSIGVLQIDLESEPGEEITAVFTEPLSHFYYDKTVTMTIERQFH